MFKLGKDTIVRFLREDLPVIGVDLVIGGIKLARDISDKAARLIADGTIPAPGFMIDKAREKVEEQDDFYRVAEPEHGWNKGEYSEEAMEEAVKGKAGREPATKTAKAAIKKKAKTTRKRKKKTQKEIAEAQSPTKKTRKNRKPASK